MGGVNVANLALGAVIGYLLGAVPTGVIVGWIFRRQDVREHGSGHTGGLNVYRLAGLWAAVITGVVDLLLALAAATLTAMLTGDPWAVVAAGVLAVVGHNWSIFVRFSGGIGLSSLAGGLVGLSPVRVVLAAVTLLAFWIGLIKLLRIHRARATIVAMLVMVPLLWAFGIPVHGVIMGAVGGLVVIVKTIPDWNRSYD